MPTDPTPKPIVLGITGASGTPLGLALLRELLALDRPVELILTEKCIQVMQEESGFKPGANDGDRPARLCAFLGLEGDKAALLRCYPNHDIGARPASGTHRTQGMAVVPCSMGTLAKIACGISDNLTTRSADVALKEGRPLVLVPRESPFNAIHLENMLKLSRLGVRIVPPVLAFYSREFLTMDGQIRYTVGKVLDQLGVEHDLFRPWSGMGHNQRLGPPEE